MIRNLAYFFINLTKLPDRFFRINSDRDKAFKNIRVRLVMAIALTGIVFSSVGYRMISLTVLNPKSNSIALKEDAPRSLKRADILDNNGHLLATDLTVSALAAEPHKIPQPSATAHALVKIIPELNYDSLMKIFDNNKGFFWLKRRITPEQKWQVNALGVPGLSFHDGLTRFYLSNDLLSHVIGYVNIDQKGLAGIERGLDRRIRLYPETPIRLSIDLRQQYILHDILSRQMDATGAKGAAGIIMHAKSRKITGFVSLPSFDPHSIGRNSAESMFNRASLGSYELGSVFKTINSALLLESKKGTISSIYDASKPMRVYGRTIRDYHAKNRELNVAEIFIYSSNIGSAKMFLDVGVDAQKQFFSDLGLLRKLKTELPEPELAKPSYPRNWRPINGITMAYGHGISVTPLHLVSAVAALVDDGILRDPSFLENPEDIYLQSDIKQAESNLKPVVSKRTIAEIRRLLRLNGLKGSGRQAQVDGLLVGGKTGTADKLGANGRYDTKQILSNFIAITPSHNPEYIVFVMLDEPERTPNSKLRPTGGMVAAPMISEIIERMAALSLISPLKSDLAATEDLLALDPDNIQPVNASFLKANFNTNANE